MMKAKAQPPSLATLRELFGQRLPNDSVPSEGQQIRPGYWRKVYGHSAQDRWAYRATKQVWKREFLSADEIAARIDKRALLELLEQRDTLMRQVCVRAAHGDTQAISLMISTARGVITALGSIEQLQPEKLQSAAEVSSTWPVLLSLNAQDIGHAKERLRRLKVGNKATTPRRPGQRLDPQNFWTVLAQAALKACEDNRAIVPVLRNVAAGVKRERKTVKFWQTSAKATFYYLTNSDIIIITDWEKQCVRLPRPITEMNFKQWWSVVQFCVLERWDANNQDYQAALAKISDGTALKEFQKRNLAMSQVRKALRSLVGLRQ